LEIESRFLTLILRVEVRRGMVVEEHANHDPEERRDDRHAVILADARLTHGGITDLRFSGVARDAKW